jgi:predicted nucleotidyltransferase
MRSNLKIAIEFAKKIRNIEGILSILLFGSVARNEDDLISDIDIAIIHCSKDRTLLMKKANRLKPENVQLTFLHIDDLPKEPELVSAFSGEGLLLYGSPIVLKAKTLELKPKTIISYSLSGLKQTEKMKVNRALYGSVSISGKYKTVTHGLIAEPGIEKINRGVLLAERVKAPKIVGVLKRFGAKVRQIHIWTL